MKFYLKDNPPSAKFERATREVNKNEKTELNLSEPEVPEEPEVKVLSSIRENKKINFSKNPKCHPGQSLENKIVRHQ